MLLLQNTERFRLRPALLQVVGAHPREAVLVVRVAVPARPSEVFRLERRRRVVQSGRGEARERRVEMCDVGCERGGERGGREDNGKLRGVGATSSLERDSALDDRVQPRSRRGLSRLRQPSGLPAPSRTRADVMRARASERAPARADQWRDEAQMGHCGAVCRSIRTASGPVHRERYVIDFPERVSEVCSVVPPSTRSS